MLASHMSSSFSNTSGLATSQTTWKTAEDGPSAWAPEPTWVIQKKLLALGFRSSQLLLWPFEKWNSGLNIYPSLFFLFVYPSSWLSYLFIIAIIISIIILLLFFFHFTCMYMDFPCRLPFLPPHFQPPLFSSILLK